MVDWFVISADHRLMFGCFLFYSHEGRRRRNLCTANKSSSQRQCVFGCRIVRLNQQREHECSKPKANAKCYTGRCHNIIYMPSIAAMAIHGNVCVWCMVISNVILPSLTKIQIIAIAMPYPKSCSMANCTNLVGHPSGTSFITRAFQICSRGILHKCNATAGEFDISAIAAHTRN